jgi:N-(2-amino-2-carboxyethyl)-L-glutamate synthase
VRDRSDVGGVVLVPVVTAPEQFHEDALFVDVQRQTGHRLLVKTEGLNFAGSIKLKAAVSMVDAAVETGELRPGMTIVESSSGNLGVAISLIAANRGLNFVCVTDDRCNPATVRMMRAVGATVHVVTEPDPVDGYLGARLRFVRNLAQHGDVLWLNQYANEANWGAHYRRTAPSILREVPDVDVLFVGAGTTGTLMGCARFMRDATAGRVRVVGVDSVGSVTFGTEAGPRHVPGLGAGVRPEMFDADVLDDTVLVPERDGVRFCRQLARTGFLFGGSTGTVLAGAVSWLAQHDPSRCLTSVAIGPDLGERYLETVYDDSWVAGHFGDLATASTDETPTLDSLLARSA